MMDWQQIAALLIVAAAAVYLIRTQILAPKRGGCGGCPSAMPRPDRPSGAGPSQLVQIDLELPGTKKKPGSGGGRDAPPALH